MTPSDCILKYVILDRLVYITHNSVYSNGCKYADNKEDSPREALLVNDKAKAPEQSS